MYTPHLYKLKQKAQVHPFARINFEPCKTVILIFCRLKKIQEKKKIMKQKAEAAKKAKGITEG